MLRTILVGLDGSPCSQTAVKLGLELSQEFQARLVGHAIVNEPYLTESEAVPVGAAHFKAERDAEMLAAAKVHAQKAVDLFSQQCQATGVQATPILDIGTPVDRILWHGQTVDLILLGQKTFFHFNGFENPDDTLEQVLRNPPRPLVLVPEAIRAGESVVIGYDGGMEATRSLYAFVASGLGHKHPTYIVTLRDSIEEANRIVAPAVEYLRSHGVQAEARPGRATASIGKLLLAHADELKAKMLVMGAFGRSTWYEFLFGCTTTAVLKGTGIPVFLYH